MKFLKLVLLAILLFTTIGVTPTEASSTSYCETLVKQADKYLKEAENRDRMITLASLLPAFTEKMQDYKQKTIKSKENQYKLAIKNFNERINDYNKHCTNSPCEDFAQNTMRKLLETVADSIKYDGVDHEAITIGINLLASQSIADGMDLLNELGKDPYACSSKESNFIY